MRVVLAALGVAIVAACAPGPVGNNDVPEPARPIDIRRYGGLWYEFARYENGFERDCEAVTAQYALLPSGDVSVKNTCREDSVRGPARVAEGTARPAGDPRSAKFKVSFFGPALLTNYWVLDRGEAYDWAIVGEGSGRYLWLLTREPRPTEAKRLQLLARAQALGYDTKMLRYTQHLATE